MPKRIALLRSNALIRFADALRFQELLVGEKSLYISDKVGRLIPNPNLKTQDYMIMLQHHPVYTGGKRSSGFTRELGEKLRGTGADVHECIRGGQLTCHSPGQIVLYPILDLRNYKVTIIKVTIFLLKIDGYEMVCERAGGNFD